jgi:hypothetical protein
MRNRDFFLPSFTTLILSGLVWFLSCAHQNHFQDEEETSFERGAEQQLLDANRSMEQPDQEQSREMPLEATTDLAVNPNPESNPDPELVSPFPNYVTGATEKQIREAVEQELTGEITRESPRKWFSLRVPKIPSKAILRHGSKVNRFYFIRVGDSPKKVSELIYSNSKFSEKLTSWNGKVWSPGQVIFYVSPTNPKDELMASFYQEQSIQPEEYRVQGGDWLTRIAKKKLGSLKSWREIAVLNGLRAPNSLEVGQTLAIYSKNLLASRPQTEYAQTTEDLRFQDAQPTQRSEPTTAPAITKAPPSNPLSSNPKIDLPPSQPLSTTKPKKLEEVVQEQLPAAVDWKQNAEQNSVVIFVGAALIILLFPFAVKKRRQKKHTSAS